MKMLKTLAVMCAVSLLSFSAVAAKESHQNVSGNKHNAVDKTLKVAVIAKMQAQKGKEAEVENFLKGALPAANKEAGTKIWFALKIGPSTFGIFDAFPDEDSRQAHLAGSIASALMAKAPELFEKDSLVIEKADVLAVKVSP